jgi:predicted PurR-regulated permease PerM
MAVTRLSAGKVVPVPEIPASAAETAVVGFIIVVALYFGQAVFVPLALAVILSFILAPPVRILRRWGLPRPASVVLVVVVAFALIFSVGAMITQQVADLAEEMPRYQLTLTEKVKALKLVAVGSGGAFERASATLKNLQKELDKPDGPATQPAQVTVAPLSNSELAV